MASFVHLQCQCVHSFRYKIARAPAAYIFDEDPTVYRRILARFDRFEREWVGGTAARENQENQEKQKEQEKQEKQEAQEAQKAQEAQERVYQSKL